MCAIFDSLEAPVGMVASKGDVGCGRHLSGDGLRCQGAIMQQTVPQMPT